MKVSVVHPSELGASEIGRWRHLRAGETACASPYFAPAYIKIIGAVRADARVAIIEDGGVIQGFLPVQRSTPFSAMGLGAPISDYQGLIGPADFDPPPQDLCKALKVGRVDILSAPTAQTGLAQHLQGGTTASYVSRFGAGGAQAFDAMLKENSPGTYKKQKQKHRKLEREHGPAVFTPLSRDRALLETLLEWKREQCRQTRQPPVWSTPWIVAALDRIWAEDDEDFRPLLSTLHVNDKVAAVLFLLQSGRSLHAWMIGHGEAFETFSPGVLIARHFLGWAADRGFSEVDWGSGSYAYKDFVTNHIRSLSWGSLSGRSFSGILRGGFYRARRFLEGAPIAGLRPLPGKAMRRLDVYRGLHLRSQ